MHAAAVIGVLTQLPIHIKLGFEKEKKELERFWNFTKQELNTEG